MTRQSDPDEIATLYKLLLPVLSRAAIGDFSTEIEGDITYSPRVNEILVGVEVLLEVIREKISELETANAELTDSRDRSVTLLDEVLRKSLE